MIALDIIAFLLITAFVVFLLGWNELKMSVGVVLLIGLAWLCSAISLIADFCK